METRFELEDRAEEILGNIKSEIQCRAGQLFNGDLIDAIGYAEDLIEVLETLNNDEYESDEDEE